MKSRLKIIILRGYILVKQLFEKYYANPRLLHEGTVHKKFVEILMHRNRLVSNRAINSNERREEYYYF
jgi:hypothetical protein